MRAKLDEAVMAAYEAVDYSIPPEMVEKAVLAALIVLRDPELEMIEAGQKANNLSFDLGRFEFLSREEITDAWQEMIDVVLADQ